MSLTNLLLPFLIAPLACIITYMIGARELYEACPKARILLRPHALLAYAGTLLATTLIIAYPPVPASVPLWLLATFAGLLVTISWLDLETGMLSDALTVVLGALALGYDALRFDTFSDWLPTLALACGLLALGWFFAGPYSRWRQRDMLGWGDVKFFAAAGLWLVPLQLPIFLILAGGAGALAAAFYKMITGRAETPFAPALCLSLFLCVVLGFDLNLVLETLF